ncbi:hypothetical protein [Microbacterium sp. XT11]|uniref:hypothetical protein n=1 Tax=Microbacterium sp. XT11 TaxID=367477 RepID=UPI000742DD47|nr:hypothetical protein [Microbacterium sp. XT11]ALX66713.1 hypothetical protein AB663_002058 [Microbacterium sp. XT11]
MHWDRLFEDLEGQLASEWEAEKAALDAESERLRISRLELRDRLRVLCSAHAATTVDLPGGRRMRVALRALGADWVAVEPLDGDGPGIARTVRIVPLDAVRGLSTDHGMVLASLEDQGEQERSLRERMALGFVLRDLARRRVPVRLSTIDGGDLYGTIDRAGADHLDVALHDAGDVRRASSVRGFSIVPFSALAWVQTAGDQMP